MTLTQLEMALRGEPKLRFKFHTQASSRITSRACLGNREALTHTSDNWWEANWWTKSWWERSRWRMMKSESFFITQDFAPTLWQLLCVRRVVVHALRVARTFFRHSFFLRDAQTSRARMAQGVCSEHVISLHLVPSVLMFHPPSLLFPHGHFETTVPSAPSSYPTPKRASSALPHDCRGA